MALTVKEIDALRPDPDKRREIPDGAGLYLIIQPNGKKSWALRYRLNGQKLKATLGSYEDWTLKEAREKAEAARTALRKEQADPRRGTFTANPNKGKPEDAYLARTVIDRYLTDYAASKRTHHEKARLLGIRYEEDKPEAEPEITKGRAVERWGKRDIRTITRDDVHTLLNGLLAKAKEKADKKPELRSGRISVNRTFSELRKFFNWCVAQGVIPAPSPMMGMGKPVQENASRERTLMQRDDVPGSTDDELRWLWLACEAYDRPEVGETIPDETRTKYKTSGRALRGPFGPLVQMLILTGARRSEVIGMRWDEVNVKSARWTIPGSRSKNGKAHMVPLSDEALAVLDTLPRMNQGPGYVFTTNGESPVSGMSKMKRRLDKLMAEIAAKERGEPVVIQPWTVHDIRRTCATGMQRLGVRLEVTEAVLNHRSGSFSGIVGVYQLHDYAEEKRDALGRWAGLVMQIVGDKAG